MSENDAGEGCSGSNHRSSWFAVQRGGNISYPHQRLTLPGVMYHGGTILVPTLRPRWNIAAHSSTHTQTAWGKERVHVRPTRGHCSSWGPSACAQIQCGDCTMRVQHVGTRLRPQ
eukprot:scaffold48372_cov67-Phaeocystis_antarctica.AAC.1